MESCNPRATLPQSQLALNDCDCPRTQHDAAILPGIRAVLIDSADARLGHTQDAAPAVVVGDYEGNFLRGTQAGEKAQLIVVALGFAPVTGNRDSRKRMRGAMC